MDQSHLAPGGLDGHGDHGAPEMEFRPDFHEEFFSTHLPSRPASPAPQEYHPRPSCSHHRKPRKIVLCFDGTGNKFHGDDSDSNILKIFRMLDRTASEQCTLTPSLYQRDDEILTKYRPLLPTYVPHFLRFVSV